MKPGFLASVLAATLVLTPVCHADTEKMLFAIDVIRHGDRTPLGALPAVTWKWKQGYGQLTPTGMRQEYQLGSRLRTVYVDQYHLLPAQYQPGTLYVRSSDLDRTLMSAESFLMGLYPRKTGPVVSGGTPVFPQGYQPIPIHTVPNREEKLLWPDSTLYNFDTLLAQYIYPSEEWRQKETEVKPLLSKWSEATGIRMTTLKDVGKAADRLYIDELYHVPLPAGLTRQEANQIIRTGRWAFVSEFKNTAIGKITGSRLLQTVSAYMQKACLGKTSLKYVLFSAHDSTLLSQMSALEAPLNEVPHYASDLNFALFQNDRHECRVEVKFNGKPVFLPQCGGTSCSVMQFAKMANTAADLASQQQTPV